MSPASPPSMTYKNAAAGLPLGGGKAVIIADPATQKTPDLLRAFGRAIESLKGQYFTAEDMGVSPEDMSVIGEETAYVAGLPAGEFASGDPHRSPHVASSTPFAPHMPPATAVRI